MRIVLDNTIRSRLAAICRRLARRTGDGRYSAAASVLMGIKTGRRAVDDSKALRYARSLLDTGVARSAYQACCIAAELHAPPHQVETTRDRLRRKFRSK